MFAWIIHAKSTFPDQCRGLAEREEGRGKEKKLKKKNNLARMRIATGCTVSMAMGCSPATQSSAVMLGTPLSTPRQGQALRRGVLGVQLPSRPQ